VDTRSNSNAAGYDEQILTQMNRQATRSALERTATSFESSTVSLRLRRSHLEIPV
jgi:hypothetical protein